MRVGGTSEPWFKQQKVCERSRKGVYPIEKTANENIIMSEKHDRCKSLRLAYGIFSDAKNRKR